MKSRRDKPAGRNLGRSIPILVSAILVAWAVVILWPYGEHLWRALRGLPTSGSELAIESAEGESWVCTTVGEADFESWRPRDPIEGETLHLEAQMVFEGTVYELGGLSHFHYRTNIGPIYFQDRDGHKDVLSAGDFSHLPPGFGEWGMEERAISDSEADVGMEERAISDSEADVGIEVAPRITPRFRDKDGAFGMLYLDVVDGNGCSLQTSLALCFTDCVLTREIVPIYRQSRTDARELSPSTQD